MTDLCSAVFVLRPDKPLTPKRFLGRAAHKIFLLMLARVGDLTAQPSYRAMATELHDLNAAKPLTVSDLFPVDGARLWMRVTGLEPTLCAALMEAVRVLPNQRFEVDSRKPDEDAFDCVVEFAALSQHEWAIQTTYPDFVRQHWKPVRKFDLNFMTPTVIRSVGVYRPFPEPKLIFRLLYERFQKFEGLTLPFTPEIERLELFADYLVGVADYQLTCLNDMPTKRNVVAFYGNVTLEILRDNDAFQKRAHTRQTRDGDSSLLAAYEEIARQHHQYTCLINTLAAFAFYSGVGSYTAQGMGMVRQEKVSQR